MGLCDEIEGYSMPGQCEFLFTKVLSLNDNAKILEIGAYKGRFTTALAMGCCGTERHIDSVDTWDGNDGDCKSANFKNTFRDWATNLAQRDLLKHVTAHVGYSEVVLPTLSGGWDLVLIDGSHDFIDVTKDFLTTLKMVGYGSFVALHDVTPEWPGPTQCWEQFASRELKKHEFIGSLAVGQKV